MSLIDYLDIKSEHNVIAVVGAGGKTSIVFALAKAFYNIGKKVCITTTTKMFAVEDDY